MTSPDVHALTGAYVLDAVPELERVAFERHLSECGACSEEVRELRETATRLGRAAAAEPPPFLKNRVLSQITQVRQLPPEIGMARNRREAPRWALRLTTAAAAVLLAATGVLGVLVARQQDQLDDARAIASVVEASDVRIAAATVATGGTGTVLASPALNRAVLIGTDLPDPGSDRVYQAWFLDGDNADPRSAGLLPKADATGSTALALGDVGTAGSIGLTVEPAGGSDRPTSDVIMKVQLRV